jgi:hypothetical protein
MREFDALSPPLRRWLAGACLRRSPRSVRKVWASALARHGGDVSAALANLERAERKTLARDIPKIWGRGYRCCTNRVMGGPPLSPYRPIPRAL